MISWRSHDGWQVTASNIRCSIHHEGFSLSRESFARKVAQEGFNHNVWRLFHGNLLIRIFTAGPQSWRIRFPEEERILKVTKKMRHNIPVINLWNQHVIEKVWDRLTANKKGIQELVNRLALLKVSHQWCVQRRITPEGTVVRRAFILWVVLTCDRNGINGRKKDTYPSFV